MPMTRRLVAGKAGPTVGGQLFGRGGLAWSASHDCSHGLSPCVVRYADHGHFGDLGVFEEEFLDLARVDVLSASDDHVLEAALDAQESSIVHRAQVASVIPAVRINGRCRLFGHLEIAPHHAVATHTDFTD